MPGASAGGALRSALADAGKHASPNAGWPEAAMAGALGLALGGPRAYHGTRRSMAPTMGAGRRDASGGYFSRFIDLQGRGAVLWLVALAGAAAGVS